MRRLVVLKFGCLTDCLVWMVGCVDFAVSGVWRLVCDLELVVARGWLFAWLDLVLGFVLVGFEVVGGCFGAGVRDPSWWGLCWAGVFVGLCWYLVLVLFVLGCFGWCLVCGVCGCLWGLACGVLGFGSGWGSSAGLRVVTIGLLTL